MKLNLKPYESENYIDKTVTLPVNHQVLPDTFTKFNLFTITHDLEVILDIKWRPNLKVKFPIKLFPSRNYPLRPVLEDTASKLLANVEGTLSSHSKEMNRDERALSGLIKRYPDILYVLYSFSLSLAISQFLAN